MDVGHQSYAHKLLTGRYEAFHTLRQKGGISGFPQQDESEYDAFTAGHASTAISAALGMARTRDIMRGEYDVVALVGDGACVDAGRRLGGAVSEADLKIWTGGLSL